MDSIDRYIDSISQFGKLEKNSLYAENFKAKLNGNSNSSKAISQQIANSISTGNPIDKLLYLDSKTYLPSDILTKVDRMSMATSLEARVPLLDQDLIDYITQKIPTSLKLKGDVTKYITVINSLKVRPPN